MHDITAIRKDPAAFDKNWARRGLEPQTPAILKLDEERRAVQTEMQALLQRRNEASKEIGQIKAKGGDAAALMAEVAGLKDKTATLEEKESALADSLNAILSALPNLLEEAVPNGKDEHDNREVRKSGEPKLLNSEAPDHVAIGERLGMMDFDTAAKMSGSRFVLMHSGLARLERALAQFMLDTHTMEHGYTEVSPPLMVRDQTMYGTGQLPKFADDLFSAKIFDKDAFWKDYEKVREEQFVYFKECKATTDEINRLSLQRQREWFQKQFSSEYTKNYWLIPTAEVSLTNIVADEIIDSESFPRRYTAHTPCFRSEAGAAGKDTKGMIRQHQFYKVELVSIVEPDKSAEEHERMTACAENILKKLGLSFRTMVLCSGDIGFGARKTYDLEVWLPGQQKYREISSCSNCGDFQARRMKARFRRKGEKDTQFVHTLNGSGVAVGRALIAVLENYHDPSDGGVFVPDALLAYMGGVKKIMPLDYVAGKSAATA